MLTATLTRPTSIAATTTCDTKLALTETIDVGALAPPKSRTISLEPIIRHPKAKHRSLRSQEVSKDVDSSTEWVSPRVSLDTSTVPQSPAQSDAQSSAASTSSSGNRVSFRLAQAASTSTPSRPSPAASSSKASIREKTITANIELTKAGCLAGDTLLIRVNVQHSKAIKSLHGIIVTLYRQGRIDYSPPLSLFGDIDAKEAQRIKHNEYYPKSKTGLGGLSLTSAGSSSVFRKDLSQTFAPLIVDPHSLISTLTASVKVPEDAFPTISGVPGAMISFKYYVEVIVDLGGKLAGQQRHLPRLGTLPTPGSFSGRTESGAGMLAALSGSTVDTEHLRREKSVVACAFEVIVGTRDSERTRKTAPVDAATRAPSRVDPIEEHSAEQEGDSGDYPGEYDYHYYDAAAHGDELYDDHYNYDDYHEYHDAPPLMPPPNLDADVDPLDDKERIRRAEERLLPSQPPGQDAPGPSTVQNGSCTESTPLASLAQPDVQSSVDESPSIHTQLPTHPSAPTIEDLQLSSPPALSSVSASVNGTTHGDDKRELERQRLLAEASSPFDHVEVEVDHHVDSDADAEPESSTHALAREPLVPSAPHLTLEPYGYSYAHQEGATSAPRDAATLENLPQYER